MNLGGHLAGGIVAGVLSAGALGALGRLNPSQIDPSQAWGGPEGIKLAGVFLVALAAALFPDLDQATHPQRWFYRALFLGLLYLFVSGHLLAFALITLISLLPLLHQHRGWTHRFWAPLFIALLVALAIEYHRSRSAFWSDFDSTKVLAFFSHYWIYLLAAISGHQSHLWLDRVKKST